MEYGKFNCSILAVDLFGKFAGIQWGFRVFLVMLAGMILISSLYWPNKGYSVWLP